MSRFALRFSAVVGLLLGSAACVSGGDQGLYDGDSAGKPLIVVKASHPKIKGSMPLRGMVPVKGAAVKNAPPAGAHLTYRGGNVVQNATYVNVFWGAYWTSGTGLTERNHMNSYMTTIAPSAEFASVLAQYTGNGGTSIHTATFAGEKLISGEPGGSSKTIDDSAIAPAIDSWVQAGLVPAPSLNQVYAIHFPKGVSVTMGSDGSCTTFCGYHSTARTTRGSGGLVRYITLPYPDCSGCQFESTVSDSLTVVDSHEMSELETDPDVGLATTANDSLLGWYDDANGEIGDICAGETNATVLGFRLQTEWSNADNGCIATKGNTPPPAADFSVSASPSSQTVTAGGSAAYTVTVAGSNGFSGAVAFTVAGFGTGASGSFSGSVSGSGSATLNVTTTSAAATGSKTLTITAKSGSLTHTTTVSLAVNAASQAGFSIAASPGSLSLTGGSSGTSTVTVTATGGFNGNVTFAASGLPSGVTASFSPASVTGGARTMLTLTAAASAPASTGTVTVTGTSGSASHSATIGLTVTSSVTPSFSVAVAPGALTVATGSTGAATLTVGASGGFNASVALAASGAPSGVTVTLDHSSLTGSGSAGVTVAVSGSAAAGSYVLTFTGTSGGASDSARLALTVTAKAPPPPPPSGLVFFDDAESGMTQWTAYAQNQGDPTWGIETSTASKSGSHRFRSNVGRNYASNAVAVMYSDSFSLESATSAALTFTYKFATEANFDFFYVWASGDDGQSWTQLAQGTGTSKGWNGWAPQANLDLSDYAGSATVRIAFTLQSDESVTAFGVAMDDIAVTAQ